MKKREILVKAVVINHVNQHLLNYEDEFKAIRVDNGVKVYTLEDEFVAEWYPNDFKKIFKSVK